MGRTWIVERYAIHLRISTHSPRVGRVSESRSRLESTTISTHSPRVGRTRCNSSAPAFSNGFQLTRPVWGEPSVNARDAYDSDISTHSPRVGRTARVTPISLSATDFNSLAPCGANPSGGTAIGISTRFQLTRPVWGEPKLQICKNGSVLISTHSPRVGRTRLNAMRRGIALNFNSLAPCGANRGWIAARFSSTHFNSLAPCGANPDDRRDERYENEFQLTRPVWGEPERRAHPAPKRINFNSLAPCGANPSERARPLLFN